MHDLVNVELSPVIQRVTLFRVTQQAWHEQYRSAMHINEGYVLSFINFGVLSFEIVNCCGTALPRSLSNL